MKRSAPWLTALLQTVILLAVIGCATPWLVAAERFLPTPRRSGDITLNGHQARPVYNGSVVPGGVYSIDELRAAIARDPIVAAHYHDADVAQMRAVTLPAGRAAYVSYRRGDRLYWTRERVWLKAGETVLTDGTTTIRARCGNCVSDVKQEHVAAVEPAHGELDDFVVPPNPDTGVDSFAAEAEAGLADLLEVPLAPNLLATLEPGAPPPIADLFEERTDNPLFPFFGVPPLLPGGGGQRPSRQPQPLVFVPFDTTTTGGTTGDTTTGGTTTGGSTSGDSTTGSLTGSPTGSPTTGDVTTGDLTTGSLTTGTGSSTTGFVTDGTVFPTSGGVTTSSSGATEAPEPETLWLLACAVMGLASRRLRSR